MNYDKILFIGIMLSLASLMSATAWAQNITQANDERIKEIADQTSLATDEDVNNTYATLAAAGIPLAGGIATVFGKLQNDKRKINNALRRIDKEQKDALDAMNLIVDRAGLEVNKAKTFYEILNEQVIPGSGVNTLKLGQNWHQQYKEYSDWYDGRYKENPE